MTPKETADTKAVLADMAAQIAVLERRIRALEAMWLQLAMAVSGKKTFVECRFCERQIEISTAESGFRSNRVFCSQTCKTNDYRKRKREAIRLARRGKKVAAIAKLVATEPKTIRAWVGTLPIGKRTGGKK